MVDGSPHAFTKVMFDPVVVAVMFDPVVVAAIFDPVVVAAIFDPTVVAGLFAEPVSLITSGGEARATPPENSVPRRLHSDSRTRAASPSTRGTGQL
jgi:hypothetical protein